MTSAAHRSGTSGHTRFQPSLRGTLFEFQGDEPLTRPEHIESLIAVMQGPEVEVGDAENRGGRVRRRIIRAR